MNILWRYAITFLLYPGGVLIARCPDAGEQQNIGVARAGGKGNAALFQRVARGVQRLNLLIAAVAGSAI